LFKFKEGVPLIAGLTTPIKIGAGIHTWSILRIYPPPNFGGLKFDPDIPPRAGGKRGRFAKVSNYLLQLAINLIQNA
jgi:hypothetical protein